MGEWLDIAAWLTLLAGCYSSSLWGLITDMRRFKAERLRKDYLTNGDVAFAACIAVVFPVGWAIGLRAMIGLSIDWEAPFGKARKP